jgi:hypothetical protein
MVASVTGSDRDWVKSVGDVAAPLFAGFSFTAVIVVSVSVDKFRWPGWAILVLTIAVIVLIMAVQCSKYARDKDRSRWITATRLFYQAGSVALLLGLGLALAPPHGVGLQGLYNGWLALLHSSPVLESLVIAWQRRRNGRSSEAHVSHIK